VAGKISKNKNGDINAYLLKKRSINCSKQTGTAKGKLCANPVIR
jgi:hypothetical protein